MKAKIIKIGNSQGIMLSKQLLQQYDFEKEVEIIPKKDGILLKAAKPHPRSGWREQFEQAFKEGHQPDGELLEGFSNEFDETEWTW
jgi:antitoxin MazE